MAGIAIYGISLFKRRLEVSHISELFIFRFLTTVMQRIWNASQPRLFILGNLVLLRSALPPLLLLPTDRAYPNTPLSLGASFYDHNIDRISSYIHSSNMSRLHVS
jgi:hypothetical protein